MERERTAAKMAIKDLEMMSTEELEDILDKADEREADDNKHSKVGCVPPFHFGRYTYFRHLKKTTN